MLLELDMEKIGGFIKPLLGIGAAALGGKALLSMFNKPKAEKTNYMESKWDYDYANRPYSGQKVGDNIMALNTKMPTHFKSLMSTYSPAEREAMFKDKQLRYRYATNQDDVNYFNKNKEKGTVWGSMDDAAKKNSTQ